MIKFEIEQEKKYIRINLNEHYFPNLYGTLSKKEHIRIYYQMLSLTLGMKESEIIYQLINNFKGMQDEYELIYFKTNEDAQKAIDWIEGIIIMKKLTKKTL